MNDAIKYYLLTLIFYVIEIILFILLYKVWIYDIFWLNLILRVALVTFFSIIVRNVIFKDSKNFYIKFLGLIVLSPFSASLFLKLLTLFFPTVLVVILKLLSDLISSILVFLAIKKIA